ncbi:BON domain-containing protein [Mesorhizobium sp. M7D.F.Ca.US.005.01.1.1]|uniref:BON domain-containing protein n=1 Tax=Mesorhizobium sp. M7D.F.Ca.US.005.01.1.1 TaxID=2493678 RepID=UPI000F75C688|nr:BON domain-containing protein [Mesorhizobium sp. M7D.F.Ca.US.005.01.1.1]AZO41569.1 BON domain-containing protein [Mesorhizobium sp. M7D.F.Ca.US.005.01.1.1]
MRSDRDIKQDLENELKWDPDINATDVGVTVKKGVVSLTGYVPFYMQKYEAENAAKRVKGVLGIANDIEVQLPSSHQKTDPELARAAIEAISIELPASHERFKVIAKDGWLTLEGDAEWQYQRNQAESATRKLHGVKGVINRVVLKPRVAPVEIKAKIETAFKRSAEVDAQQISVTADGGEVILAGAVSSWSEKQEAERTAWRAPGVVRVHNHINIVG